jgi:hypothetical protein
MPRYKTGRFATETRLANGGIGVCASGFEPRAQSVPTELGRAIHPNLRPSTTRLVQDPPRFSKERRNEIATNWVKRP